MPQLLYWYAKCSLAEYLWTLRLSTTDQPRSPTLKTGSRLAPAPSCCSLAPLDVRRRRALAASSAPLLYRGITGHWPALPNGLTQPDNTKAALGGTRGVHVRESIRLEVPLADVYRFWRRLENLPRFMTHLDRVTETSDGTIALGGASDRPGWPSSGTPRSSTRSRTS